jgi:outer membrane protein assembly factor BamB
MRRRTTRIFNTTLLVNFLLPVVLSGSAAAQLASAPWPIIHHDARHTGQSEHVGPQTNAVKWVAQIGYPRASPTIGPDGVVYIATKFTVYALDPDDGSARWTSFGHNLRRNAITIDVDGRLYFGSRDNRLNVLDSTQNGALLWEYRIANDGDVNTSPVIAPNPLAGKVLLYAIGTWDGLVHAFDPDPALDGNPGDSRLLWRLPTYNNSYSSPAVGPDGTVYSASGGNLWAVGVDGVQKWATKVGRFTRFTSPAIGADGTIYIGSSDGLSAVNPDGTVRWTFPVSGRVASTPAIANDGTIYIGSLGRLRDPGKFYAVNPDGTERWSYAPSSMTRRRFRFMSSPAIGADGTVYASANNTVFAFTSDGNVLWQAENESRRTIISSPAIGADGTLYIGARRGIYAFGQ